jgi:hypothetical protein
VRLTASRDYVQPSVRRRDRRCAFWLGYHGFASWRRWALMKDTASPFTTEEINRVVFPLSLCWRIGASGIPPTTFSSFEALQLYQCAQGLLSKKQRHGGCDRLVVYGRVSKLSKIESRNISSDPSQQRGMTDGVSQMINKNPLVLKGPYPIDLIH